MQRTATPRPPAPRTIALGDVVIALTLKDVKHTHLTVHPPEGRVSLVAPRGTRPEVARAFAASKLAWIREQRAKLRAQPRETPRAYVERETHALWGRHHLLRVVEADAKPDVSVDHRTITLRVRPGSTTAQRHALTQAWHRRLLREAVPPLIAAWEPRLGVRVAGYFVQRMKTKWGSCNPQAGTIRLNTELVKKPRDLLEYVVVHEMAHLLEPTHGQRFVDLLDRHYPSWRSARLELNELPVAAETWGHGRPGRR